MPDSNQTRLDASNPGRIKRYLKCLDRVVKAAKVSDFSDRLFNNESEQLELVSDIYNANEDPQKLAKPLEKYRRLIRSEVRRHKYPLTRFCDFNPEQVLLRKSKRSGQWKDITVREELLGALIEEGKRGFAYVQSADRRRISPREDWHVRNYVDAYNKYPEKVTRDREQIKRKLNRHTRHR